MVHNPQPPSVFRFGTFEVDLRAGELRKQGVRIKLQEQPFHVLTLLIQKPGEVVTREELRNHNWSPDTFVDFDNSLNTAINKLREALGDSADNPRFIETLPRRGYRFLAPVKDETKKMAAPSVSRHRFALLVAFGLLLTAAAIFVSFSRLRGKPVLTEKDTIVLGDFANSTGDPVFDSTLREGLSVQLEQSPFLSLVSEEGIQETLKMMGQSANVRLTPQIAREVCQRTNSTAALDGSIALVGTRYDLILKAVNCVNGDLLANTQAQANDKSHVLDALSKASSEMRTKLGESLITVQKYNTPLEQATTPSLEALQAYTLGNKAGLAGDGDAAVVFCQKAIQLDPNFAMAYDLMGASTRGGAEAAKNFRKAFELRSRVSQLEKLEIEGDYYNWVTGDLMKARSSYALGAQIYPREFGFRFSLGLIDNDLGQYDAGLKEYLETLRLAPYNSLSYRFVAYSYLLLDRSADAASIVQEARTKGLDSSLGQVLYSLAFYRNDISEMERQVAASAGRTGDEDLLLALQADTAAYFGHLAKARELSRRASISAKRAGDDETSAVYEAVASVRESMFGIVYRARQRTASAKEHPGGQDTTYAVLLALAYAGATKPGLADDLNQRFPEGTVVQFNYLPTIRAKLALNRSNPEQALDILKGSGPYELGLPAFGFYNWPDMYPVYVRGEAYLANHRGAEAAAEFQKILDHRGIVLNEPIGALAHLQLGRAYTLQGDTTKARVAYQDFLALWKDADPDIPVLKQAKAEYAKLQ